MKKIRIGKDFRVLWEVNINGEPITEMYRDVLKLIMVNPRLSVVDLDFYIRDGKVCAKIDSEVQKYLGLHKLTLLYEDSNGTSSALDEVEAFWLVRFTSEEDWGEDDNIDTDVDIELEGNLTVTAKGESAYETWLGQGFTGSEMDFLNWLRADLNIVQTGKDYEKGEVENG
jgi:hypothetical protein